MRVAVIGAEGALGKRIAAECAERGYSVSALPARPEELLDDELLPLLLLLLLPLLMAAGLDLLR